MEVLKLAPHQKINGVIAFGTVVLKVAITALPTETIMGCYCLQEGGFPVPFSPAKKHARDLNVSSSNRAILGTENG